MVFENKTELQKELYNLTFEDKQKAIKYLLDLMQEDFKDINDNRD